MDTFRRITRHQLIEQQGKFLAVGIFCTFVDFGVFNALAYWVLDLNKIVANTASFLVSASVSFVANRFWTFERQGRVDWAREALPFLVVSAAGLGLSNVAIWVSARWLSSHIIVINLAKVAGVGTIWFLKFFIFRNFVFVERPQLGLVEAEALYPSIGEPAAFRRREERR